MSERNTPAPGSAPSRQGTKSWPDAAKLANHNGGALL